MKRIFIILILCVYAQMFYGQSIVAAEYFIDVDPEFGNGTPIAIVNPSANIDISLSIEESELATLSQGWHKLYLRTRDLNGKWSHTLMYPFEKIGWQDENLVVGAEYFFDTDLGVGECPYIEFDSPVTNAQVTISIPAEDVPTGLHWLYIRTKDLNGEWSHTQRVQKTFTVVNFVAGALHDNNQTICRNTIPQSVGFSSPAAGSNLDYRWFRKNGLVEALGDTSGWTRITYPNQPTFIPTQNLLTTTTFACWVQSSAGGGWAGGQMQITVLPQVSYGVLQSGNQTLATPANPAQISFSAVPAGSGSFSYQWYYIDALTGAPSDCSTSGWTIIQGATSASYDPPAGLNQSRTYACFVTPTGNPDCGDGCWASGTRQVTISIVGVDELSEAGIVVYPNPFNDVLIVEQETLEISSIRIYDMQGRVVLEKKITTAKEQLSVEHLSAGVYTIQLQGTEVHYLKVVRQ